MDGLFQKWPINDLKVTYPVLVGNFGKERK